MEKCISCSEEFDTREAMKRHHCIEHGESIAGEIVECDNCGDEFRQRSNRLKGNNFCDEKCFDEWQLKTEENEGPNNERWESLEVPCSYCQKKIYRQPHRLEKTENCFCSSECENKWRSENIVGENHWQWKENSESINYGKRWFKYRREIRELDDNKCQICGVTKEEYGMNLDVHHVIPVKKFENVDDAHKKCNMVLLCRSCHRNVEKLSEIEQKEKIQNKRICD